MLVIVPDSLESSVMSYVNWKNKKGIKTTIKRRSEISGATHTTAVEIKIFLIGLFNCPDKPEYVLLVGVLGDSTLINKSDNSGNNWASAYNDNNNRLICLHFLNVNTGWAAGFSSGGALILKTTNGGNYWEQENIGLNSFINSIYFPSQDSGWYCGNTVFKSTNGGSDFVIQIPSNGVDNYNSIFFKDNNQGWVVSNNSNILTTVTGGIMSDSYTTEAIITGYSLSQNYPNPFNPETVIRYSIPLDVKHQNSDVKLVIYNSLGMQISTLINENQNPGSYYAEWNAENNPSGVYFINLLQEIFLRLRK